MLISVIFCFCLQNKKQNKKIEKIWGTYIFCPGGRYIDISIKKAFIQGDSERNSLLKSIWRYVPTILLPVNFSGQLTSTRKNIIFFPLSCNFIDTFKVCSRYRLIWIAPDHSFLLVPNVVHEKILSGCHQALKVSFQGTKLCHLFCLIFQ